MPIPPHALNIYTHLKVENLKQGGTSTVVYPLNFTNQEIKAQRSQANNQEHTVN